MVTASGVKTTFSHCQICEQACGIAITSTENEILSIEPDRSLTFWRDFCIKGAKAGLVRDHPMRLKSPMRRVGRDWQVASYDEALDDIAARLERVREEGGPDALGSYTGNPNGFSISNSSFHNAFMAAFGSTNRFWVGSIDQNAHHYVAEQMYGSPWTCLLPDIDRCECLMLIGANPAISAMSWMGSVPEGWRRVLARPRGSDLIVVDPRMTETAKHATLHLQSLPDTDWALLLVMLKYVVARHRVSQAALEASRLPVLIGLLAEISDVEPLCRLCGLERTLIEDAAERFASARTASCIARTGPALGRYGTLTEWLAHALNLLTGRTDVPGGRYLNVSPVNPIMMGATLFPEQNRISRVHRRAPIAGAYAIGDLPDEIETPGAGQVRALLMNSGNPVISGPNGNRLAAALRKLDLFVGIDLFARESHKDAHWLIPGTHFLERDEFNPMLPAMSTDPHMHAGRAALDPPAGVRPEWTFYRDLAERLDLSLFDGALPPEPKAIVDLMLSTGDSGLTFDDVLASPHGVPLPHKGFGHLKAWTLTADKKINIAPEPLVDRLRSALRSLDPGARSTYAMISRRRMAAMNSWLVNSIGANMRDQRADAIEMNAVDAETAGFRTGDVVRVVGPTGSVNARLIASDAVRPGVVVVEQGWGGVTFDPPSGDAERVGNNRNEMVSAEDIDPLSNVPRLNGTRVRISLVATEVAA